jgi:hypothetical protein
VRLSELACARSGDKGGDANIGVIAWTSAGFEWLRTHLTATLKQERFSSLGARRVARYELPNLGALNFVLSGVLDDGGAVSLRIDAQGKALGQALLELELEVPEGVMEKARRPRRG